MIECFSLCFLCSRVVRYDRVRAIVAIWSSPASFSFCTVFLLWFARFLASRVSATWSSMMFHVMSSCTACVSISPMSFVPVAGTGDDQQMWFVGGDTVCVITCVGQSYTRWSVVLRYDELLCESCRFLARQDSIQPDVRCLAW